MLDHVAPRWVLRVEQQLEGEIGVAGLGQFFEQIGRAQKAGAQQAVVGFDLVDEFLAAAARRFSGSRFMCRAST